MDSSKVVRVGQPVSVEVIDKQPNLLSAIMLSIQVSGREEKQIYGPLRIDKGTWSKIMSGQFSFPTNKYEQLMNLVGNEVVLIWLARRRGKGLHDLEDSKDKRIRELENGNQELRKEIDTLVKYGVLQRGGK